MSRSRFALRPLLLVLALVAGLLCAVATPTPLMSPARAEGRVTKDTCRAIDPNLVNGVCLRYRTGRASGLTWIGSYRAPDGRVFFCIDFLYDSRLPAHARTVSTRRLVNQLGQRVGAAEVAAVNHVISTWAAHGSTGSDARDAAIALIVREVMGDGVRPGGAVVYPRGLEVGERVRPPAGGLGGRVLRLARRMWTQAATLRGPYRLSLTRPRRGPVRLGRSRTFRVSVLSATGRRVPGVRVRLTCRGPVRCPARVVTKARARALTLTPRDLGRFRIRATARGPAADGLLYRERSWHSHGGSTARPAGHQRAWIARSNRTTASAGATAIVRKARPEVLTQTSEALVRPGAELHDVVTVSGLPASYDATVRATLFGPFASPPGRDSCTPDLRAGRVSLPIAADGTYATPSVRVTEVGYYTWVEDLPGDEATVPLTTRCGLVAETTRVVPFTPTIRTTVSRQRAQVGDEARDLVEVSGVQGTPLVVEWTLRGPRAPRDGSCGDLDWSGAPIADRGSLVVPGDGRYATPDSLLGSAGCHTYEVRIPATSLSDEAASPPGLASETTLVTRRVPTVTTLVSAQRSLVGDRLRDEVRLRGLRSADRVVVRWWLLGPVAPDGSGTCRDLDWAGAPVADQGTVTARGNGTRRTRGTTVSTAGCYTYRERLPRTPATEAVATLPGLVVETSLVTRPVTPVVPEIPSGFAIGLDDVDLPTRRARIRYLHRRYSAPPSSGLLARRTSGGTLTLRRLRIGAPVAAVGLDRGTMAIPDDPGQVGWLRTTATAGDLLGSSVMSGHVSDRHDRPGALWRLREARAGDVIRWREPGGVVRRFEVSRVRRYPRRVGVPAALLRTTGPHLLHLVTCTGRRRTSGGFHYADNLVVTAVAVRGR